MFEFGDVVDAIESVPEEYRTGYEKNAEGKFAVKAEFKPFVVAIRGNATALAGTKKDLTKAHGESAQRRQAIKAFEDLLTASGVTVEEGKSSVDALKAHLDALALSAKNGGELKINLEAIKADFKKQTDAIKTESDTKVGKMQGSLERYLVGDAAKGAISDAKGSIDLLMPHVRSQVKVVAEGEDYVVRVVDGEGNLRLGTTGSPMSIKELIGEMKTKPTYARAFESDTKGGSGTQVQTKSATPMARTGGELTSTGKIAAGLAKGRFESGGRMKAATG